MGPVNNTDGEDQPIPAEEVFEVETDPEEVNDTHRKARLNDNDSYHE